jgi:hypothetical protein
MEELQERGLLRCCFCRPADGPENAQGAPSPVHGELEEGISTK